MGYGMTLESMGGLTFSEVAATSGRMELMLVTPEIAAKWLGSLYKRQRKQNQNAKTVYETSMKAGHWKVSNDAITITRDGECINGQHRLIAVVESNLPIVAWVLLDADPAMYDIIDNINARPAAQVLNCENANDVAAIAKTFVVIESGGAFSSALRSTNTIPRWMITERADSDMAYIQELVRTYKVVRTSLGRGAGTAFGLAIHSFATTNDGWAVRTAADYISEADDTTLAIHKAFQRKMQEQPRIENGWVCGTFLQFLEAKRSGKTVKQFRNQSAYVKKYEGLYRKAKGIDSDD